MQIVKVEAPAGLAKEQVNAVQEAFRPSIEAMAELEERYKALTDIKLAEPTKEQAKEARTVRLALVKTRTGTRDVHKTLKADALVFGRYLDGYKKAQEIACTEREAALLEIEKYAENMELERIAKLTAERERLLSAVGVEVFPAKLGEMEEAVWDVYYDGAYQDKKRRDEAKRVEEAQRIVKEKAEAEERRVIEENARKEREEAQKKLDAERVERERLEAIERERVAAEEKAAAEKKAAEEAEAKRVADLDHQEDIKANAECALGNFVDGVMARRIINAIASGTIPHVSINY